MNRERCDALIIGAGPSGAAAATRLADAGLRVTLLDKGEHPYPHLPETYGGFPPETMEALGLGSLLKRCLEPPRSLRFLDVGTGAGFTLRPEIPGDSGAGSYGGQGMQLDRSRFDAGLLEKAVSLGARYLPRTRIRGWIREGEHLVGVSASQGDRDMELEAALVIDATGKAGVLPNLLGLRVPGGKFDARQAVFSHFNDHQGSGLFRADEAVLFALADGYIFASPLPLNRFVVMAVLQDSRALVQGLNGEALFRALVEECPPVFAALGRSDRILDFIPAVNRSWSCPRRIGRNFLVIGESATFRDPFFNPGIRLALEEGVMAAAFSEALLGGRFSWDDDRAIGDWEGKFAAAAAACFPHPEAALGGGLSGERFLMACADPHLPWMFPSLVSHARSRFL